MKLTLVHPAVGKVPGQKYVRGWQMEPLPPAYIAARTPEDVEIVFRDDRMEEIDFDHPTDLAALSVETYTARRSYQIASEFRRRGVPVVMGGFHPTLIPEEVVEYAEAVVIGEAETVWPHLLEDFGRGSMKRVYRATERPDIARVAPDRSIFSGKKYLPIGLVERGRGCPHKCDFCVIHQFFQSSQNWRDTETVIEEIKRIKDKTKLIFFVDDNIVSHNDQAKAFYEALIPLKIKWVSQAAISLAFDDELLRLFKASGCQGVLMGFESLNLRNLKSMNKAFNAARGGPEEAVRRLHRYGLRVYATFMFGYDGDTLESFQETLEFCIRHKLFVAAFNHLVPFPGTELYRRLESEGRLFYDKWWLDEGYRFGQVPFKSVLPPQVIRQQCLLARKEFYSSGSIFKRLFHPTNSGDLSMIPTYLFANWLLRREAHQRLLMPLGDVSYRGPLLKVRDRVTVSYQDEIDQTLLAGGIL